LRRSRLAHRWTDIFGGIEFIAPDVHFTTTNAGTPNKRKNAEVMQSGAPAKGKGQGRINHCANWANARGLALLRASRLNIKKLLYWFFIFLGC